MDVRDLFKSNGVYQAIGPKSQLSRTVIVLVIKFM